MSDIFLRVSRGVAIRGRGRGAGVITDAVALASISEHLVHSNEVDPESLLRRDLRRDLARRGHGWGRSSVAPVGGCEVEENS